MLQFRLLQHRQVKNLIPRLHQHKKLLIQL